MIKLSNIFETQVFVTFRYFVINSIFVACIYFGMFAGVDGALNIALAMGWITSVAGIIILLGFMADEKKMTAKIAEELERKVVKFGTPKWFDLTFDIAVAITFLWTGYIFLALCYTVHIYGGLKIRNAREMSTFNDLKYGVDKDE